MINDSSDSLVRYISNFYIDYVHEMNQEISSLNDKKKKF